MGGNLSPAGEGETEVDVCEVKIEFASTSPHSSSEEGGDDGRHDEGRGCCFGEAVRRRWVLSSFPTVTPCVYSPNTQREEEDLATEDLATRRGEFL